MPIYDYLCGACGHEHEAMQKMNDAPLTTCPECGEDELKKQLSAAGFRLKGGGWYETDFKGGNSKKNVAESSSAKSSSGHKCGTGSCGSCN
ncbi:FmdB family zinc ribbon protein [Solemya velum gill symbiont]|uniref:Putative regulatory protein n=1 Tax=Solemya velum gill symbiont TaxID=2340 RepID=A0A0B0HDL1_SOVGS|nr:FmdB family zinc ribbon protein [Solemya velum gill symbiont]KHF25999.1 putative regulatory protein [Solemya velum gill symbiont]OOY34009.1 transcriptional regulator [Solemya velum gill symbiont]OOY36668.1 transcriptional regulator [Solemya velum gill symbiont]OOY39497.1 transcriptional regulator [Solemya velum gill symbiont]OOY44012.1 transcriptional regulator [Solemya velum gill symbiont]